MNIKNGLVILTLLAVVSGYAAVQQAKTFAQCKFAISKLDQMNMAGINVDNLKSVNDLNLLQAAKLATTYASGSLPLSVTANLKIRTLPLLP